MRVDKNWMGSRFVKIVETVDGWYVRVTQVDWRNGDSVAVSQIVVEDPEHVIDPNDFGDEHAHHEVARMKKDAV